VHNSHFSLHSGLSLSACSLMLILYSVPDYHD